jgi:hypothetical protein
VIKCTIASVVPETPLNLLGKDNITFTGTNFPHEMEGNTFELAFDNDAKTACEAVDTNTNELVCLTDKFNPFFDKGKTYKISIVINGLTVDNSFEFKTKADIQASKDLNPNSVNPVLKTIVTISLDEFFPYELKKEEFSVNATAICVKPKLPNGEEDPTPSYCDNYVRYLNVLSVDDSKKTIRAMFGGARSGAF